MARQALGMGLKALIPDADDSSPGTDIRNLSVDLIDPNPYQPRREPDPDKLKDLVESIKEKGVVQPVLVRLHNERYQLIAGERRFQAVKLANFNEIPAIIRVADNREMLELALIENIQREDLNPIDEALAYQQLMQEFNLTQDDIAKRVGKDRSTLANSVRLLKLSQSVQNQLVMKAITVGHARALLALDSFAGQENVCHRIIKQGWTVRDTEKHINQILNSKKPKETQSKKDIQLQKTEELLQKHLGTKIHIKKKGQKGYIQISFASWNDLERLIHLIGISPAELS